ncbi:MAG: ferrous iron transport protein A [Endomicrobium sp.]|nr:ferrous iron transport protein A [Endomicrobium sp.]
MIVVYCSEKLEHRLLEMGFIPGENLTVVENTGPKGGVTVKIKGAKVALSSEVAYKILLERKNN